MLLCPIPFYKYLQSPVTPFSQWSTIAPHSFSTNVSSCVAQTLIILSWSENICCAIFPIVSIYAHQIFFNILNIRTYNMWRHSHLHLSLHPISCLELCAITIYIIFPISYIWHSFSSILSPSPPQTSLYPQHSPYWSLYVTHVCIRQVLYNYDVIIVNMTQKYYKKNCVVPLSQLYIYGQKDQIMTENQEKQPWL